MGFPYVFIRKPFARFTPSSHGSRIVLLLTQPRIEGNLSLSLSISSMPPGMAILPILKEPNEILRQIAKPVSLDDLAKPEIQNVLDDMVHTMHVAKGIGLAAPQVGISKRLIVVLMGEKPRIFINPEIISSAFRKVESEEGCLSVPRVFGIVKRTRGVEVKALDRNGKCVTVKTNGLPAIIFQHEIDHLNGTLFIDKIERLTEHHEKETL